MKFVDEVEIVIGSGSGGPGCVSFRRETHVPRGGPDGGDGGRGGDVIIETSDRLHSLLDIRQNKKYLAQNGQPGRGSMCSGLDGKDMVLQVPPGTLIRDIRTNEVLFDLKAGERITVLSGGLGGKGNHFYKTSINQAPSVAQKGLPGQVREVRLELKLIADVGIIGFPNAGKSTLISHISKAKPKIADYPFTTLNPNLGVVPFGDDQSIVVADIPGLIEGAHQGVGLGTKFLKHIERTKVFVHLIDGSDFSGRDPIDDFEKINFELKQYDLANSKKDDYLPLSERPQIVAINKTEIIEPRKMDELLLRLSEKGIKPIEISAATGLNLDKLILEMGRWVFKNES